MRRRALVGAVAAAVLAVLAAWVLVTDVGAPQDPFPSSPHACDLVSDEMVADLVGSASSRTSEPVGGSGWRPLYRGADRMRCEWADPDEPLARRLQVEVERHHSTQFRLGRTGSQRAEASFEASSGHAHCPDELAVERGRACASSGPAAAVTVLRDNVVVRVSHIHIGGSQDGRLTPDQLGPALVEEVMSRLDRTDPASTPAARPVLGAAVPGQRVRPDW